MLQLIPEEDGLFLLAFARSAAEKLAKGENVEKPKTYLQSLDKNFGVFCTITKNGALRARGVAGVPAFASIIENTIEAAKAAVSEDPRFPPIRKEELQEIKIELAILSEPELIVANPEGYPQAIKEGDGVLLKYGMYESLFPPMAWRSIKDKHVFLDTLCLSAGLTEGMWKEREAKLYRFDAQVFSE